MKRWTYSQGTGQLTDPDGRVVAVGYSGRGPGRNNCEKQHIKATGPIPRGLWSIGTPRDSKRVGPFSMDLLPMAGTETFGRSALMIHGDNRQANGTASSGCVILARKWRNAIWDSGVRVLEVVR